MALPTVKVILDAIDNASPKFKDVGTAGEGLASKFVKIGAAATAAAAAAVAFAGVAFFRKAIDEAREAEISMEALKVALTNAGQSYAKAGPEVDKVTDAIQRQTRFSGDDARDALTRLITLTGDYEGSLKNLPMVMDIATARNIDLSKASDIVSKAMEGNRAAVKKLVPDISLGADLVESLGTTYHGFAENAGKTFSGRLDKIKNQWNDVAETVGLALIQNDAVTGSLDVVANTLANVAVWVQKNSDGISGLIEVVENVAMWFVDLGQTIVSATQTALAPLFEFLERNRAKFAEMAVIVFEVGKEIGELVGRILTSLAPAFALLERMINPVRELLLNGLVIAFRTVQYTITALGLTVETLVAAVTWGFGQIMSVIGDFGVKAGGVLEKVGIKLNSGLAADMRDGGKKMVAEANATSARIDKDAAAAFDKLVTGRHEFNIDMKQEVEKGNDDLKQQEQDAAAARLKIQQQTDNSALAQIETNRPKVAAAHKKIHDETRSAAEKLGNDLTRIIGETIPPLAETTAKAIAKLREEGEKAFDDRGVLSWHAALDDAVSKGIVPAADKIGEIAKDAGDAANHVAAMERMHNVADAALGAASSFGIISKEAENALTNVMQIADNLPKVLTGDPTAILSVAASLGSVLTTVFGDSAADQKRQEALRKNTDALKDLVDSNKGLLELESGSAKATSIQEALNAALNRTGGGAHTRAALGQELIKRGLSFSDVEKIAKDAGIDLEGGNGAFSQLQTALGDLLNGPLFGVGFDAERERLKQVHKATDADDSTQLSDLAKLLADQGASVDLDNLLKGGSGAADELAKIFSMSGTDVSKMAGKLSAGDFLETVQEMIALLRGGAEFNDFRIAPPGAFGSVDAPTISLDSGERSMLTADVINEFLPTIESSLGSAAGVVASGAGATAAGAIFGDLYFTIHGVDAASAHEIGTELGDALFERVDKLLGQEVRIEKLRLGRLTVR